MCLLFCSPHDYVFFHLELIMSTFEVILDSVANPGKFTFITVEDCKDLEDCVNHIETEFSHEFIIDQIREVFA